METENVLSICSCVPMISDNETLFRQWVWNNSIRPSMLALDYAERTAVTPIGRRRPEGLAQRAFSIFSTIE